VAGDRPKNQNETTVLEGTPLVVGLAFGYAHFEDPFGPDTEPPPQNAEEAQRESMRLRLAVEQVRNHLDVHVHEAHAAGEKEAKNILEAHLLILDDEPFFEEIHDRIERQLHSAEQAVREAFNSAAAKLSASDDSYLAARAEDLRDICQSIRKTLVHGPQSLESVAALDRPTIFVSATLRPSYVLRARRAGALGYATACTALTSHAAILLRSSAMPAVAKLPPPSRPILSDTPMVVDGDRGRVVLWPDDELIAEAKAYAQKSRKPSMTAPVEPARLASGEDVTLWANIDNPAQIRLCLKEGLAGVGLFRTEFMILDAENFPDEEMQLQIYEDALESLQGRPLIIRTFDIGGDKDIPSLEMCSGDNPALGVRGIRRHLLRRPEELIIQLRAILRAAVHGEISILLPMVTNLSDLRFFRRHLETARESLEEEGLEHADRVRIGAMIEVPSAAMTVSQLLEEVDFISIGTNDLMQYLTAADRDNTAVLRYHELSESGLLELLGYIMEKARAAGRESDVTVCGDLAAHPEAAGPFVELGIRSLSIPPLSAPVIRRALTSDAMERAAD
jgi:phosphotransferase system enzyme I (PtsI)